MSLRKIDFDNDGDLDVLSSNRKGDTSRVHWLENLGGGTLKDRMIGAEGRELLFLDYGDLNGDEQPDIAVAVKSGKITLLLQESPRRWTLKDLRCPSKGYGSPKAVRIVDIDNDRVTDLAVTCESADGEKSGVYWLKGPDWLEAHDIGGPPGIKYDRIEMIDLDGDGDLDLLTCEERDQLGVHWYENPTR